MEDLVGEKWNFEFDSFRNRKPVKIAEDGDDAIVLTGACDQSS